MAAIGGVFLVFMTVVWCFAIVFFGVVYLLRSLAARRRRPVHAPRVQGG